jgi:hypothetical protein
MGGFALAPSRVLMGHRGSKAKALTWRARIQLKESEEILMRAATTIEPEFILRPALAKFLNRSEAWVRREEAEGRGVRRYRLGKTPQYRISDVRAYMEAHAEVAQ